MIWSMQQNNHRLRKMHSYTVIVFLHRSDHVFVQILKNLTRFFTILSVTPNKEKEEEKENSRCQLVQCGALAFTARLPCQPPPPARPGILGAYWEHIRGIFGAYSGHIGSILGAYGGHIWGTSGTYSGHIVGILVEYGRHTSSWGQGAERAKKGGRG